MSELSDVIALLSDERKAKLIALLSATPSKGTRTKAESRDIALVDKFVCTLCGNVYEVSYIAKSNSIHNHNRTYHVTHCDNCGEYLMQYSKEEIVAILIGHFTKKPKVA